MITAVNRVLSGLCTTTSLPSDHNPFKKSDTKAEAERPTDAVHVVIQWKDQNILREKKF